MENRYCKQCWKIILLENTRWFWQWKNRKFCNSSCYTEFKKTIIHTNEYKQKMSNKLKWRKITWSEKLRKPKFNDKQKEDIRKRMTWRKSSEETRKKQSQAKLKNPTKYWLWKRFPLHWNLHPNWKWWVEKWNIKIRHSHESRNWRRLVFERDKYLCQRCFSKWKYLNAHHILNFSSNKELRFELNNWITLCKECHNNFHKLYWRENNNMKQIKNFINNLDHPEKAVKWWKASKKK